MGKMTIDVTNHRPGESESEKGRHGVPDLHALIEIQVLNQSFPLGKLLAKNSTLARKLEPIGKGLDSRELSHSEIPVQVRMDKVRVRRRNYSVARRVGSLPPAILAVCAPRSASVRSSFSRRVLKSNT